MRYWSALVSASSNQLIANDFDKLEIFGGRFRKPLSRKCCILYFCTYHYFWLTIVACLKKVQKIICAHIALIGKHCLSRKRCKRETWLQRTRTNSTHLMLGNYNFVLFIFQKTSFQLVLRFCDTLTLRRPLMSYGCTICQTGLSRHL